MNSSNFEPMQLLEVISQLTYAPQEKALPLFILNLLLVIARGSARGEKGTSRPPQDCLCATHCTPRLYSCSLSRAKERSSVFALHGNPYLLEITLTSLSVPF